MARRTSKRRWEVTGDELERMAAARRGSFGLAQMVRILVRSPRLIPEVGRATLQAVQQGLWDNNALVSLVDSELAREAVPDAARGVGWFQERTFVEELSRRLRPDMRVLELGCGGGRISRYVAPLVAELVCTDVSRAMVAEARQNLATFPNVQVAVTNGFALPEFGDATFDVVFAQGVLGYIDPNPAIALLDEVRRVLRHDGVCVFNFHTIDDPDVARHHAEVLRKSAQRGRFSGGMDRGYSLGQIETMYVAAGLQPTVLAGDDAEAGTYSRVLVVGHAA